MTENSATLERILETAEKEFMDKGFQGASLRNIVKMAGVTTGAFYRYFSTKEALFEALVKPHAEYVKTLFTQAVRRIEEIPSEKQAQSMTEVSSDCLEQMLDYVYAHFDRFKLLICSSYGTVYENFIHDIVELEVDSTYRFISAMESIGLKIPDVDRDLCHMISSGLFSGIFEMVIHDMDHEQARRRVRQLKEFYTGGWERLMGISFG